MKTPYETHVWWEPDCFAPNGETMQPIPRRCARCDCAEPANPMLMTYRCPFRHETAYNVAGLVLVVLFAVLLGVVFYLRKLRP